MPRPLASVAAERNAGPLVCYAIVTSPQARRALSRQAVAQRRRPADHAYVASSRQHRRRAEIAFGDVSITRSRAPDESGCHKALAASRAT